MNITRLQIFDFDDTLFRVPSYTSKTQVETMGYRFGGPYEYYDHPISLDEKISNIQLIGPVYDAWREGKEDPGCIQVLITHRVEGVKREVEAILEARNMSFDQNFFLGRVTPKVEATQKVMEKLPELKTIEIYEDSVNQIIQYQEFFQNVNNLRYLKKPHGSTPSLEVKTYIVDKSTMFRIENLKLSEKRRIVLI